MYNTYFAQTESEGWWPTQGEISTAETVAETVLPLLLSQTDAQYDFCGNGWCYSDGLAQTDAQSEFTFCGNGWCDGLAQTDALNVSDEMGSQDLLFPGNSWVLGYAQIEDEEDDCNDCDSDDEDCLAECE